jgi:hypothetical protein
MGSFWDCPDGPALWTAVVVGGGSGVPVFSFLHVPLAFWTALH